MCSKDLNDIIKELDDYRHSKSELLQDYVELRLNQNLSQYYRRLNQSVTFLKNKNSVKILNRLDSDEVMK